MKNTEMIDIPMIQVANQNSQHELEIAQILEAHRGETHLVVMHDFPDPDAISAAYAHQLISAAFDIRVDLIYDGEISHQQNLALVKLLGIDFLHYGPDIDFSTYQGTVFVDNQGTSAEAITEALDKAGVPVLIVIDHHERQERLTPAFADIRRVGATASIYAEYLERGLIPFSKSQQEHVIAATALMHGLMTDTNNLIRATPPDFRAAGYLSQYRDEDLLEHIMSQERSKQALEIIHRALGNRLTVEGFTIAGIGYLRAKDRDAIPQAADFLLSEENVHTAIIYGIVTDDDRSEILVGSMRTSKFTIDPDRFIKDVFGANEAGQFYGGGKMRAGGLKIPLGFLSGGHSDSYRELKWQVYDSQIKHRIFTKIGVEPQKAKTDG